MTLPAEDPKPETKKIVPRQCTSFLGSWLKYFSSSTGWRVMVLQNSAKEVTPAGLQVFTPIKMSDYTTALKRSVKNI